MPKIQLKGTICGDNLETFTEDAIARLVGQNFEFNGAKATVIATEFGDDAHTMVELTFEVDPEGIQWDNALRTGSLSIQDPDTD
jgi:hypothetical protein